MATQFKQIQKSSVMCTVQGCGEVAAFYARHCDPFRGEPVLAAYCKEHAEAAAERHFHTTAAPSPSSVILRKSGGKEKTQLLHSPLWHAAPEVNP
jgi:hypothetical protein